MRTITLEKGLATFINVLSGKNRSAATIRAYSTDIAQFISFLHANGSVHMTQDTCGKQVLPTSPSACT
jgi:site-specific recombinase XerD